LLYLALNLPAAAPVLQEEQACRYRLEVQTSDLRRAGTAANVFVTIIGDSCAIGAL
jgi:hypothetical protein